MSLFFFILSNKILEHIQNFFVICTKFLVVQNWENKSYCIENFITIGKFDFFYQKLYNFFYKPQSNTEVFCKQIEVNFEEFCTNISINLSIPNKKARKCGYIFCYGFFLPRTLVIENLEKILCRNLVKLLRMISIIYLEATQLSLDLLRKEQKLLFLDFSIHVNCENWQNLREKRYNWKNFEI